MPSKINSRAIREANRSIILEMIRRRGPISRAELARDAGLSKPTVGAIVEELIGADIVEPAGIREALARMGRPAQLLRINDASAAYLAIDFGARATTVAVADANGAVRAQRELVSIPGKPKLAIDNAVAVAELVVADAGIRRERVESVGVSVAGLVHRESGACVFAPSLGWRNVPIRDLLRGLLHLPVEVWNATLSGAVAEGRLGAANDYRSYVWLTVGSGVGAGVVLEGRPLHGSRGFSGEIGHCRVVEQGIRCSCGAFGCLDTVASDGALEDSARRGLERGIKTSLASVDHAVEVHDIVTAALAGDAMSRTIIEEVGAYLGRAVAYLQNILDPEVFVVAGTIFDAGALLLEPIRQSASSVLPASHFRVVRSALRGQATIMGAVLAGMTHSNGARCIVRTRSAGQV